MSASASAPHPSLPISKTVSDRLSKKASRHVKERIIEALLFCRGGFLGVRHPRHRLGAGQGILGIL
jgi:hypothetical protein